ncbi:MAG: aminodeoxychorismate/anthranilate synthase component II [Aquisalinus sp.]|nr:aminodeoxychorismate/anthranilate synthase component II [Aquisalinus sp.]
MILVIDNYDSFTWNLVHLVGEITSDITVHRNDAIRAEEAVSLGAKAIILSPGPCTPDEAGICLQVAELAMEKNIPLFGVCLGHQSIAQACGAEIIRAPKLMHGKTSKITHSGERVFQNLPSPFTATRYHSLSVLRDTLPEALEVTASSVDDNEIMALKVKNKPAFGVQFHPESIATEQGVMLIQNFLELTAHE